MAVRIRCDAAQNDDLQIRFNLGYSCKYMPCCIGSRKNHSHASLCSRIGGLPAKTSDMLNRQWLTMLEICMSS